MAICERTLSVALADPDDMTVMSAIRMSTGLDVDVSVAVASEIRECLDKFYGDARSKMDMIVEDLSEEDVTDEQGEP